MFPCQKYLIQFEIPNCRIKNIQKLKSYFLKFDVVFEWIT